MKNSILYVLLIFSVCVSAQNQNKYALYLKQALQAIDNVNEKEFEINLRYFTAAIEKNEITPEILTETNLKLYTKCLYEATVNGVYVEEDLAQKAMEFVNYDIENRPENMVAMGVLYEEGLGVPQDYAQAQHWFEKAARKGNPDAMIHLVYAYSSEDEKNDRYWQDKAVEIYTREAEKGDTEAMLKLSIAYQSPLALEESEKARFWCEKAAQNGNTGAMFYLGYNYDVGIDGEQNYAKALPWYEKAARKGHLKAMYALGGIYYSGDETLAQDHKKAKQWLKLACDGGFTEACYFYESIP